MRYTDPGEMVRLAELALCSLRRLKARRYGRAALADLRARTWAELGNSYRVAEDLWAAEQAFGKAISWARRGSGDPFVVARIAMLATSLWCDQGRRSDAIETASRASLVYRQLGDRHLAGQALFSKGIYIGNSYEPRKAILSLCEGLTLIDLDRDPELQLSIAHEIAWRLVECGQFHRAHVLLWQLQGLYQKDGSPLKLLRWRWLKGRIYVGLTHVERAEMELRAAKEGFEQLAQTFDAALVALDLAMLWVQQGRRAEARQLADEMIATFKRLRIAREAVAALILTRASCDNPRVDLEDLHQSFKNVSLLLVELQYARGRQPHRKKKR